MKNILKIAIIDRSEIVDDLCSLYTKLFNILGYDCDFNRFDDHDQTSFFESITNDNYHVVICDISLGDSTNLKGLNLINSIKSEKPHLICIGNSKVSVSYRQTIPKYPTFDLFVDKLQLSSSDKVYYKQLAGQLSNLIKVNTNLRIDPHSQLGLISKQNENDVIDILSQITFTGHPTHDMIRIDNVTLKPLTEGRSGSEVYKLTAFSSDSQIDAVPSVLKISKLVKAKIEVENFHRFVKWTLPYSWRVDIIGTGYSKKLGGICYSFIRSENEEIESLTRFIKTKKDIIIAEVIKLVFSPKKKTWYKLLSKKNHINQRYMERYFEKDKTMKSENNALNNNIQEIFGGIVTLENIKIGNNIFPLPRETLFGELKGNFYTCICHGDLNSNNIIVSPNKQFIFIDFQDTGRGHVFEDFIALESSLRLHYPLKNTKANEILESELGLAQNCRSISYNQQLYKHIKKIRELAFLNFIDEPKKNYNYAISAYSFRLLRMTGLSVEQKTILTSTVLANLIVV